MMVAVMKNHTFDLEEEMKEMEPTGFAVTVGNKRFPLFKGNSKEIGKYKISSRVSLAKKEDYEGTYWEGRIG